MPGKIHMRDSKTQRSNRVTADQWNENKYRAFVKYGSDKKAKERFHRKPYGNIGEAAEESGKKDKE